MTIAQDNRFFHLSLGALGREVTMKLASPAT